MRILKHGIRPAQSQAPVKEEPVVVVEEQQVEVLPDIVVDELSKKAERKRNRRQQFDVFENVEANEE
jgi:hypothetical protein